MQTIRKAGRNTSGVKVVHVEAGDVVACVARCPKEEIIELVNLRESKDHVDYYEMLGNVFMFHFKTEENLDFADKAKTFYELYLQTSGIFAMPIINRINELKVALN